MAEARQVAGLKLAVKPDGKIEIDWSSGINIKHVPNYHWLMNNFIHELYENI